MSEAASVNMNLMPASRAAAGIMWPGCSDLGCVNIPYAFPIIIFLLSTKLTLFVYTKNTTVVSMATACKH